MKIKSSTKNVAISTETHAILIAHVEKNDSKAGKFTDKAIKEKIERENKTKSWP